MNKTRGKRGGCRLLCHFSTANGFYHQPVNLHSPRLTCIIIKQTNDGSGGRDGHNAEKTIRSYSLRRICARLTEIRTTASIAIEEKTGWLNEGGESQSQPIQSMGAPFTRPFTDSLSFSQPFAHPPLLS